MGFYERTTHSRQQKSSKRTDDRSYRSSRRIRNTEGHQWRQKSVNNQKHRHHIRRGVFRIRTRQQYKLGNIQIRQRVRSCQHSQEQLHYCPVLFNRIISPKFLPADSRSLKISQTAVVLKLNAKVTLLLLELDLINRIKIHIYYS